MQSQASWSLVVNCPSVSRVTELQFLSALSGFRESVPEMKSRTPSQLEKKSREPSPSSKPGSFIDKD